MMKLRYARLFLALVVPAAASTNVDQLVEKLVRVESRGIASAVGDNGKALGILQIHEATVNEANRIAGTRFTHRQMLEASKARQVAQIVLNHYSNHILKTTGRPATDKELAFIWNGGGAAWKRASSPMADSKQKNLENYWNKVSKAL